jgi:hypothetical protein
MNVAMSRVHVTNTAVEKAVSITYSGCVFVALSIKRAMSMRRIIFASVVTCLPLQYFSTLYNKRHDFRGGKSY